MARVRAAGQQEEGKAVSIVALICFKSRTPDFPKQIDCAVSYDITVA
jgi:hypothetical protein